MMTWSPVLFAALAARFLRQKRRLRPWPAHLSWHDALLATALGIGVALVAGIWLAPFSVPGARAVGSPDFGEYCSLTGLYLGDALHEWGSNRSRMAGLLPGLLSLRVGVFDGLLLSAMTSLALVVAGVYLWARALHTRSAGVAAAILVGAIGPLAVLGRTLTFYPGITAALTLAGAGAAAAARWRTPGTILLAAVGSGLALLIDVRGLIFAVPCVGITLLAVLAGPSQPGRPPWRGLGRRALALALPLFVSYQLGSWAYSPHSAPLERQVAIYQELVERGYELPPWEHPTGRQTAFIWGHSDVRFIPWTLLYVGDQGRWIPENYRELPQVRDGWRRGGAPWTTPFLAAVLLTLLGLRRRPWLVFTMAGTMLPFLLSFDGAVVMKWSRLRFIGSAMPFLPVALGVGLGVLAEGALPKGNRHRSGEPPSRPLALALLVGLFGACLLGAIPSYLSPTASWRIPWLDTEAAFVTALQVRNGQASPRNVQIWSCSQALRRKEGDGRLLGLLPGGGSPVEPWTAD